MRALLKHHADGAIFGVTKLHNPQRRFNLTPEEAIFLNFVGDPRHISAGFLICLRDLACRSRMLCITKHSV